MHNGGHNMAAGRRSRKLADHVPFAGRKQISLHLCISDDRLAYLVCFLFCHLVRQTRCSNSDPDDTLSHSLDFRVFSVKSF